MLSSNISPLGRGVEKLFISGFPVNVARRMCNSGFKGLFRISINSIFFRLT